MERFVQGVLFPELDPAKTPKRTGQEQKISTTPSTIVIRFAAPDEIERPMEAVHGPRGLIRGG